MESNARTVWKLNMTLIVLVSALFFIFPFWSAMFFPVAIASSGVYVGLLMIGVAIWALIRKVEIKGLSWMDALVGLYTLVTLLSVFTYANLEFTLTGIAKQFGYLFFYLLLRLLLSTGAGLRPFFYMIAGSGSLFSLYGLLVAAGVLEAAGATTIGTDVRISSVFEYPNSYASYLAIAVLLGLSLQVEIKKTVWKFTWILANGLSLVSLILSYSRGGWLMFLLAYALMVLLSPRGQRAVLNVHGLFVFVAGVAALPFLNRSLFETSLNYGLIGMGVLVAVALLLAFLLERTTAKAASIQWKIGIVIPLLVTLVAGGGFAAVKLGLIPENVLSRIADINLNTFSVQQRLVFYKDGLSALQDHALIGAGDRTWEAVFYKYQSYPYYTTSPHSVLVDHVMNSGLLGTLLFLSIIVLTIRAMWKLRRTTGNAVLVAALLAGFLELVLHALIDVDFYYALIAYSFWMMVAAGANIRPWSVQGVTQLNAWKWNPQNRWFWWTALPVSLAVVLFSSTFVYARTQIEQAKTVLGEPAKALAYTDRAQRFAPYMTDAHNISMQMELRYYERSQDPVVQASMQNSLLKMPDIAPESADLLGRVGQELYNSQKYREGTELVGRAWENAPYRSELAEQYMNFSTQIGEALQMQQPAEAKQYFQETLKTYDELKQRVAGLKNLNPVLHLERGYGLTGQMMLHAGIASFYIGQYAEAEQLAIDAGLQQGGQIDAKKVLALRLAAYEKRTGQPAPELLREVQKDPQALAYYQMFVQ